MNIGSCSNTSFTGGKLMMKTYDVERTWRIESEYAGTKAFDVDDIVEINHNYIVVKKPSEKTQTETKNRIFKTKETEKPKTQRYFYKANIKDVIDNYRRLKDIPGNSAVIYCKDDPKKEFIDYSEYAIEGIK